jgi:prepilin-type processing-associated H-X9-DG protein
VCASNQRQIVAATLMHAQEHQGYTQVAGLLNDVSTFNVPQELHFPAMLNDLARKRYTYVIWGQGRNDQFPVPIHAALASYLGLKIAMADANAADHWLDYPLSFRRIFSCPSSPRIDLIPPRGQGMVIVVQSNLGTSFSWSTNGDYAINEGFTGFDTSNPSNPRRLRGNLTRVRAASSTVYLADGQPRPDPAVNFASDGWVLWTPTDPSGRVTLADAWLDRTRSNKRTSSEKVFEPPRHRQRINVAFLDGHVETLMLNETDLQRAILVP